MNRIEQTLKQRAVEASQRGGDAAELLRVAEAQAGHGPRDQLAENEHNEAEWARIMGAAPEGVFGFEDEVEG